MDYTVAVDVVGDIADALWQLNVALERDYDERLPLNSISTWQELRARILADHASEKDDVSFPLKPQKVLWDVREFMGAADILLSDVGAHKLWIARYYPSDEPNTCLISNGFCSMGFALPGAIGAKLACPEKRVMAICGDAGFLMNVQVWIDGDYGLISWKQQNEFGRHFDMRFGNPDFEKLADAFGCWGKTLTSATELPGVLAEAHAQSGPAIIGVPIDYRENLKLTERLGQITMAS
jgi:acetolactate synthase-1/2/3 large subunit